jgi:hypothetical protein
MRSRENETIEMDEHATNEPQLMIPILPNSMSFFQPSVARRLIEGSDSLDDIYRIRREQGVHDWVGGHAF